MDFLDLVRQSTLRFSGRHISRMDIRFLFLSLCGPQEVYGELEAVLREFQEFPLHLYCCRAIENNNNLLQHEFLGKEFGQSLDGNFLCHVGVTELMGDMKMVDGWV